METPTFENLDLTCAVWAESIAEKPSKTLEKLVTNALDVLEEQGIYALFLFLRARDGEAKNVMEKICQFLKSTPRQDPLLSGNDDIFTLLKHIRNDLDRLLLARDLVRQVLVYARYHAQLPQEDQKEGEE